MHVDEIRPRLLMIDDELRALPADAFAARHALRTEQDRLRDELRNAVGSEVGDAGDQWAERAGLLYLPLLTPEFQMG